MRGIGQWAPEQLRGRQPQELPGGVHMEVPREYPHLLPRTREFHYSSGTLRALGSVLGTRQVSNRRQRLPALQITRAPLPGPIYHGFCPCLAPKCFQATCAPAKTQQRKAELFVQLFCHAPFWHWIWVLDKYCLNEDLEPEADLKQELVRLALDGF